MQLAEINISRWKISDPQKDGRGFIDNIERINALAERSDGFVWRLVDEARDANGANAVCPDEKTIMTMSVWQTPKDFEHFVWNTVHKQIYQNKHKWFGELDTHYFVMWWVEEGHIPTLEEAKERLDYLDTHGNSDKAFNWHYLKEFYLWKHQICSDSMEAEDDDTRFKS